MFGIISIIGWVFLNQQKDLVQFALYTAIFADACAAVPTIVFLWKKPWEDRPFPWSLFSIGYAFSILAISEHTWANYALPIYMTLGSSFIALILIKYRVVKKIPLKEWI